MPVFQLLDGTSGLTKTVAPNEALNEVRLFLTKFSNELYHLIEEKQAHLHR